MDENKTNEKFKLTVWRVLKIRIILITMLELDRLQDAIFCLDVKFSLHRKLMDFSVISPSQTEDCSKDILRE